MITSEELQEIERLDREATPGEWREDMAPWGPVFEHTPTVEDLRFACRARTLLPRLAAAFAEQTATIAALAAGIEAADLRALQAEEALAKAKESDR